MRASLSLTYIMPETNFWLRMSDDREGLFDGADDAAGVEPDRVGAEDGRPPRLPRGRHRVGGQAEVVVVRRPRERAVVVVAPGDLAQAVVDAHDDVDVLLRHPLEVGVAGPAGRAVVTPHGVRVEV